MKWKDFALFDLKRTDLKSTNACAAGSLRIKFTSAKLTCVLCIEPISSS